MDTPTRRGDSVDWRFGSVFQWIPRHVGAILWIGDFGSVFQWIPRHVGAILWIGDLAPYFNGYPDTSGRFCGLEIWLRISMDTPTRRGDSVDWRFGSEI